MATWLIVLIIAVVVIGGSLLIWYLLKPTAGKATNLPAPKGTTSAGTSSGTVANIAIGPKWTTTYGSRTFTSDGTNIMVKGFANGSLPGAQIPYPVNSDGSVVTDSDLIKAYLIVEGSYLGDALGYGASDVANYQNELDQYMVVTIPAASLHHITPLK